MKLLASAAALSLFLTGAAIAQTPAPTIDVQPAAETAASTEAPTPTETGSISAQTEAAPQGTAGSEAAAPAESNAAAPPTEAAATPQSVEACIATAVDLGSTAESKELTPEHAERLDALFSKLETLCDGEKFAEAVIVKKDIQTIINTN